MYERPPFGIAIRSEADWVFMTPTLQPALLFGVWRAGRAILWHDSRLEMVREGKDQMSSARRARASKSLPQITRQPAAQVGKSLFSDRTTVARRSALAKRRATYLHRVRHRRFRIGPRGVMGGFVALPRRDENSPA